MEELYEDWDDFEDEEEVEEPEEAPLSDEPETERLPFNLWCHQVDRYLMEMTNYGECIETIGYQDWWEEWYKQGVSPEEAAAQGLTEEILSEEI